MKIGIIGRSELLFNTVLLLSKGGHEIVGIVTCKASPEMLFNHEDFRDLAESLGSKFLYDPLLSFDSARNFFGTSCDIAISINYSGIIPKDVIDLFAYGVLNVHGGDLPRYRGNACQAWAILNGEERIGLCVHKMVGGELDSGLILQREFFEVSINTRIGEVYHWMASIAPMLVLKAVTALSFDPKYYLEAQSLNPKDILRTYPRRPEDGRIDWKKSSIDIVRLVNASSEPFSGAFAYFNGDRLTIWRAQMLYDNENYCAVPGQVTFIERSGDKSIHVATGQGKILITLIGLNDERLSPGTLIKSLRSRLE